MIRIDESVLAQIRKWAKSTGRHTSSMCDEALRFALTKQSEVERHISNRVIQKVEAETTR